jgi:DNA-binding transcriptional LysR family regulator
VTVCALVRQNLGIGVIDEFTLAEQNSFGLRIIPIEEDTTLRTFVAFRNDATLSGVAEFFIAALRTRMKKAHESMATHRPPPPAKRELRSR